MHPLAGRAAAVRGVAAALIAVAVAIALVFVGQRKQPSPPARVDTILEMQLLLERVHVLGQLAISAVECAVFAHHGGGSGAPVARLNSRAPRWRWLAVAAHLAQRA